MPICAAFFPCGPCWSGKDGLRMDSQWKGGNIYIFSETIAVTFIIIIIIMTQSQHDDDDDKNPEDIPTEFLPIGKSSVGISFAHHHHDHHHHHHPFLLFNIILLIIPIRCSKCLSLTSPLPSSTASWSSLFKWRGVHYYAMLCIIISIGLLTWHDIIFSSHQHRVLSLSNYFNHH